MRASDWTSGLQQAVRTRDSHLLHSLLTAFPQFDFGSLSAELAATSSWTSFVPAEYASVAVAYAGFLHADEMALHPQFVRVFTAFTAQNVFCDEWQMQALRLLCADLASLALANKDTDARTAQSVTALDTLSRLSSIFNVEINRDRERMGVRGCCFFIPINHQFRICFALNELTRCPKIIEQVDKVLEFMSPSDFPPQDLVAYNYYLGRLRLINHEFEDADKSLTIAWKECPDGYIVHKRKILLYLIPVRLVLGKPPSPDLLLQYNLFNMYGELIVSASTGNFADYDYHVMQRRNWFVRYKLFGVMKHRLKVSMFRNLLKQVWAGLEFPRTIPFEHFAAACRFAGLRDFSNEDSECICQSLVDLGYVKGYINHDRRFLVLLKNNQFPSMYSIVQ
ncbi:hypothetical protein BC830DRAFT_1134448 [Chytriomyces sp. MP71]|nr:hypothetical protein BC830DRAFT_1134448 [Chytriomyces sp. MP71]